MGAMPTARRGHVVRCESGMPTGTGGHGTRQLAVDAPPSRGPSDAATAPRDEPGADRSVPAADLRAGFLQVVLEARLFVVGAVSQAGAQEVEGVPRTVGVERDQGQVAAFLVGGRL